MIKDLYEMGCTQNREISWLRFDDRVLNEAKDESVPLLERLKFVSIYTSNLTEFFRVRVGSLYDMEKVKFDAVDNKSGLTAKGQLDAIYPAARRGCRKRDKVYAQLRQEMAKEGICDLDMDEVTKDEQKYLKKYYKTMVEPVLTAQIVDTHHPFPNLLNDHIYIAAVIRLKKHGVFGFVAIPPSLSDIVILPNEQQLRFVHTEDLVRYYAGSLFPDAQIQETLKFKIARSAYIDPEDEAFDDIHDYRKKMLKVLKERRKMHVTRIVLSDHPSRALGKYLFRHLDVNAQMQFVCTVPFSLKYAFSLGRCLNEEQQKKYLYPPYEPKLSPAFDYHQPLFDQILKKDVLLSYPYESMAPFLNLVKQSADDDNVVAIKITIYRLASHARLVEYLCQAAENGKEVDVLIELKARFDEQNNIDYSQKLEDSGCNVFYGFEHYKVHSKICLITRKDAGGRPQHVALVATGNFNENTAKQYTDLAFLTADKAIIADAVNFFQNMMIGKLDGTYKSLLVAPVSLKPTLLELIERETKKGPKGYIFVKINGLTDEDLIGALIEASQAGVRIDMVIRGISCLLPGIKGKTENIHIRSIVGRYLEHSRIYIFGTGRNQRMYISSADFMTRNTERRVEIACPIKDAEIRKRILAYVDLCLKDNVKARVMGTTGRYRKVHSAAEPLSCQDECMKLTKGAPDQPHRHKGTRQAVVFDTRFGKKKSK